MLRFWGDGRYNTHMSILKRAFASSFIAALILMSGVCAVTYAPPSMHSSGMGMVGCPFAGHGGAVCGMSPLDHLDGMQLALAAVVPSIGILFLLLLASFLVAVLASVSEWIPVPLALSYEPPDTRVRTYDPLKRYAARGLLNPKIP